MESKPPNYEKIRHYGFLGGDVSKGVCDFVLMDFMGQELESNFQLDDNRSGHQRLFEVLKLAKNAHGLTRIVVGVESTGGYENNWYRDLHFQSKKQGLEVFRINPKLIYHEGKTEGRRSKSDAVSAQVIAGYLRKNYGTGSLVIRRHTWDKEGFASMRTLHKYIQQLIRQTTRTKNRLEKLLYQFMPEILSVKPEKYPGWFLELLINYPTKEEILSADKEGLTRRTYKDKIYNFVKSNPANRRFRKVSWWAGRYLY